MPWVVFSYNNTCGDSLPRHHVAHHDVANKGFWSELLGVGDFYYELGVEAVEAYVTTTVAINTLYSTVCTLMYALSLQVHSHAVPQRRYCGLGRVASHGE